MGRRGRRGKWTVERLVVNKQLNVAVLAAAPLSFFLALSSLPHPQPSTGLIVGGLTKACFPLSPVCAQRTMIHKLVNGDLQYVFCLL